MIIKLIKLTNKMNENLQNQKPPKFTLKSTEREYRPIEIAHNKTTNNKQTNNFFAQLGWTDIANDNSTTMTRRLSKPTKFILTARRQAQYNK